MTSPMVALLAAAPRFGRRSLGVPVILHRLDRGRDPRKNATAHILEFFTDLQPVRSDAEFAKSGFGATEPLFEAEYYFITSPAFSA